jgi:hypothetical protein
MAAAPIIPADEWGMPYDVKTPDLIRGLSSLLRTAKPPGEQEEAIIYPVDDGSEHGDPVLVVGVEFDSVMYGWNWREIGVSRAVQITQWVMMSRPGHPVFLDVVGRILEQTLVIEQEEAEAAARGEAYVEPWALEWTGPGIWTDAVYRYLLVRYGFLPEDLIGAQRPIRVGDVL